MQVSQETHASDFAAVRELIESMEEGDMELVRTPHGLVEYWVWPDEDAGPFSPGLLDLASDTIRLDRRCRKELLSRAEEAPFHEVLADFHRHFVQVVNALGEPSPGAVGVAMLDRLRLCAVALHTEPHRALSCDYRVADRDVSRYALALYLSTTGELVGIGIES